MFTGLIRSLGTLAERTSRGREARLTVRCPEIVPHIEIGSSVCTNGVCLTATHISNSGFSADVSIETLSRSTLGDLRIGADLNLEPSLRVGDEVGGHFVFGHVDAVGTIHALERAGEGWDLSIEFPKALKPLIAEKGSIAIDGISLTVARLHSETFTVAVVPFTFENTRLRSCRAGDAVNLEADMLARYVQSVLRIKTKPETETNSSMLSETYLLEHGFGSGFDS